LRWDSQAAENAPYGRFTVGDRARTVTPTFASRAGGGKRVKRSISVNAPLLSGSDRNNFESSLQRSTLEIDWADVAEIFQRVEVPKRSPQARGSTEDAHSIVIGSKIFAPFCRKIAPDAYLDQTDSDESDSIEDVSDEVILGKHQVVLDVIHAKMSAYLEAKRRQQEKRKSRLLSK
jgi:hypothetical protein